MKYLIALALLLPLGVPNENGCGLGAFPLQRWNVDHKAPYFLTFDFDHDDNGEVREGRSDTGQMLRHEACVENK